MDAQIDTDPVRRPMGMACRSCGRPLTNTSLWTPWGSHDCEREARVSKGNTPDSAAPTTLKAGR